ncbi:MAG: hypothetical protein LBK63_13530 [Treponema sp.]|jgi:hypothetical protein|nr:hypothetical protein [Treponema sp.]
MKKIFLAVFIIGCVGFGFAQNTFPINEGIEDAANFLNQRIPEGTSVAVFNFSSDSKKLSDYIVDELTIALANIGINVYDRNNLDEVNREIYYGFTGAVDDNTAQAYGHDVGVKTVILGSIAVASNKIYRLRIQAIEVETKKIQAGGTFNIVENDQLLTLLEIKIQRQSRFTNEQKTMAGFKNMLFGFGSFQMGDPFGGGIALATEVGSIGLFVAGIIIVNNAADGVVTRGSNIYEAEKAYEEAVEENKRPGYTCMIMGGIGLALSLTWDFVRPYLYDKPQPVQIMANIMDHVNIAMLPRHDGRITTQVSLNYRF